MLNTDDLHNDDEYEGNNDLIVRVSVFRVIQPLYNQCTQLKAGNRANWFVTIKDDHYSWGDRNRNIGTKACFSLFSFTRKCSVPQWWPPNPPQKFNLVCVKFPQPTTLRSWRHRAGVTMITLVLWIINVTFVYNTCCCGMDVCALSFQSIFATEENQSQDPFWHHDQQAAVQGLLNANSPTY